MQLNAILSNQQDFIIKPILLMCGLLKIKILIITHTLY